MAETVLITGISGFIARHTALAALRKGYAVRGTVRSAGKAKSVTESLAAHGADAARIDIVEADLNADAGWSEAAKGCAGVFHVASPFPMKQPRDRRALVPAARDGALRVLNAGLDAGADRIVMTSSLAAVMYGAAQRKAATVGEKDWTDIDWPETTPYAVSKTEAERAAWARAEERGARHRLVAVNPGFVLGPALDDDFGPSIEVIRLFLRGAYPAVPPAYYPVVDVRDVADLHVAALTAENSGGRRLLAAADTLSLRDIALILKEAAPAYAKKIPTTELPAFAVRILAAFDRNLASVITDLGHSPNVDNAYVTDLTGVSFRTGREAVEAAVKSLMELKAV